MPTLRREAGYSFRFRAVGGRRAPHVHIEGNGGYAKFWLAGASLDRSAGYNRRQLTQIARIVEADAVEFEAKVA